MELQCLEDCPASAVAVWLTFLTLGGLGFALARWRRWAVVLWLPLSFLIASALFHTGWGVDDKVPTAAGVGAIVGLLGTLRARRSRAEAA